MLRYLFLFFACIVFINANNLKENPPISVVQKLTDKPKDRQIKINTNSGNTLCYIPTFSVGAIRNSYIGILNCSLKEALPARFDVFGRIGFFINQTWLCITAPEEVSIYHREEGYLYLYPCVLNKSSQRWKIKDNRFFSIDESYQIQDDGSYLYATWKLGKYFNHTLDKSMQEWIDTIAYPMNLSMETSLAWELTTQYGIEKYFLQNNKSTKDTTPLIYNVENGHFAQYDYLSGSLYCMYSNVGNNDWNWVWWALCSDTRPIKKNTAGWKIVQLDSNRAVLLDIDGNALRFTRYGYYWGVPYAAKPSYLEKDTKNSPTSSIIIDRDMKDWLRFINGNEGLNLETCPANVFTKNRNKRELNSPFTLTPEWLNRILSIITSTDGQLDSSGICGTCLLQSYQIVAEILENPSQPIYPQGGGYYFNTSPNVSPFISFRARNSLLDRTFEDIVTWFRYPVVTGEDAIIRAIERAEIGGVSMLPQYTWRTIDRATTSGDVSRALQSVFNSAPNTIFIAVLVRLNPTTGRNSGHAMVVIRTQDGAIAIPTNARTMTLERLSASTVVLNTVDALRNNLSLSGRRFFPIMGVGVIEVGRVYDNPFSTAISFNNCTGDGSDRRGSGAAPSSIFVNQCLSGRCQY